MRWSEIFAILLCCIIVALVVKSIFRQWLVQPEGEPLAGWYHEAERWLQANGYEVVRRKQTASWFGYLDSHEYQEPLKADYIVHKDGKSYVVEVGAFDAELFSGKQIRSSWYPICSAFGVEGILFVDVNHETVHTVGFEVVSPSYVRWKRVLNRGLWLMSGVVMTFIWLHGR